MKKLIIGMVAILLPFLSNAQSFDKYENMKEVDAVVITNKMFKLLTKIDLNADDQETQEYIDLIENLDEIRVFTSKQNDVRQQMAVDVNSYLKNGNLQELMRVSNDGKTVNFYYKPGKSDDFVSQLFMFMEGQEESEPISVILNITGEIDLTQVSRLARDFQIPGGEELKNIKRE